MSAAEKKVTVMLPKELLERALKTTGEGITPTLRRGLELVAAEQTFKKLLELRGKVKVGLDLRDSREDRDEE